MTDHLYRPGNWFALVAPRAALLVDGDFPLDRLAALWEACRNRPSLNELMNLVTAGQLVDLPGFALAVADADKVRVIVRAGVSAVGSDVKGDPRTVDGGSVSTWVEDGLAPGSRVRLTRSEAKSDGVTLPVSGGVVMAEELWWQPAEVPVEEAQVAATELNGALAGANGAVLQGAAAGGVALNGGMVNVPANGSVNVPVGVGANGMNGLHGAGMNGAGMNGVNGAGMNGMNGAGVNGAGVNGAGVNGAGMNGMNGAGVNGAGVNGAGMNGMNGAGVNGAGMNGMNGGGNGFGQTPAMMNGASGAEPTFDVGGQSDLERLLAAGRNAVEAIQPSAPAQQPAQQPVEPMTQMVAAAPSGLPVRPVAHQGLASPGMAPLQPARSPGRDQPADRTGDIRALREPTLAPARGGRVPAPPVGDSPTTVFKAPEVPLDDPSMVMGVTCRYGHVNPPQQGRCRVCGVEVPFQQPSPQQRPALGTLRFSTGQTVTLDRPVVIGRAPYADRVAGGQIPRLVRLDDDGQLISRSHVEVRIEGWNVVLEDLNSANGTYMTEPGRHPEQVEPGDAYVLEPGTEVALSQHISFVYEVGAE